MYFYLFNRSKFPSFHESPQFWKQEKVAGGPSLVNTVAEAWLRCCYWPKNYEHAVTWELAHYRGTVTITILFTIPGTFSYCFTKTVHNFQVLYDRATLWQELIMYHTIVIKENSEQNLHIWPNFASFFFSVLVIQNASIGTTEP